MEGMLFTGNFTKHLGTRRHCTYFHQAKEQKFTLNILDLTYIKYLISVEINDEINV